MSNVRIIYLGFSSHRIYHWSSVRRHHSDWLLHRLHGVRHLLLSHRLLHHLWLHLLAKVVVYWLVHHLLVGHIVLTHMMYHLLLLLRVHLVERTYFLLMS